MFDPHHIGPRYESRYSRNKGRVFQRKVVNEPPTFTRSQLEKLVPVMIQNGIINGTTPDPGPDPDPDPYYLPVPIDSIAFSIPLDDSMKTQYLEFKNFQHTNADITIPVREVIDYGATWWWAEMYDGANQYTIIVRQRYIEGLYNIKIHVGAWYGYISYPGRNQARFYAYLHGLQRNYMGWKMDWFYDDTDKQYRHEIVLKKDSFSIVFGQS